MDANLRLWSQCVTTGEELEEKLRYIYKMHADAEWFPPSFPKIINGISSSEACIVVTGAANYLT